MLQRRKMLGVAVAASLAAAALAAPAQATTSSPVTVADWQMNEPVGATVMVDSAGGHNGSIQSSDQILTGQTSSGVTYYHWSTHCPACAPADTRRVITVPESDSLDIVDPTVDYTLEFRFRTTHGYGNYMQKGQSTTKGGQIKVQGPKGIVQCLFKGANGVRVGTGSSRALNDGLWHTVQCVHTATQVIEYVDGLRDTVKNGSTGPINNSSQFTVGGKLGCDQITVTCDYFSGDIDYIKVSTG